MTSIAKFLGVLSLGGFLVYANAAACALETVKVTDGIYALVGPLEQRSPENLGNNATFGVIITSDGVVLVDPGGSARGAAEIETAIANLTDQPVKFVVNTGGQDHRWFGNGYFAVKGATIIASQAAVEDQKDRADFQWQVMTALIGEDKLAGTELRHADKIFSGKQTLTLGGTRIILVHPGQAHTPGDTFVWLPDDGVVFSGDIVYMDRMLGVSDASDSKSWLDAFAAMEAVRPDTVVPGHGRPASLHKARAETRDYLVHLRKEIGTLIENGGGMMDSVGIDQSAFKHLAVFEQLSRRNAQAVFAEMEFE